MIDVIFNKLIFMSATGGAVGLTLFFISKYTKRLFGCKWNYYIYLIPLVIMLIPFSFGIRIETPKTIAPPITSSQTSTEAKNTSPAMPDKDIGVPQNAAPKEPQKQTAKLNWDFMRVIITYAWLTGIILILCYKISVQVKFSRSLKRIGYPATEEQVSLLNTMKYGNNVRLKVFDGVSTPFIAGVFRPTIYVPNIEMSEDDFRIVLKHELAHIKRNDLLYKSFANFISIIHFFNPAVYLIKKEINLYCEMSCDEFLVQDMSVDGRKHYGKALLNLMKKNNFKLQSSACLCENEKNIKDRLDIIMRAKRMGKGTSIISIILICALTIGSVVFAGTVNDMNLSSQKKVLVNYNGRNINLKAEAFIDDETIYVPLREILNLGGVTNDNISWYEGTVTFAALPSNAKIYTNSDECFINDMAINLMGTSQTKSDVTFVPIDFFEAFEVLHEELGGSKIFGSLEVFDNTNSEMIKVYPNEGYVMSSISPDDISFNMELPDMDVANAYKNKIIQLSKMNSAYNSYFLYDMNGDGVSELFVGWRRMYVYTYKNDIALRLGEIYNEAYKLDGEDGIYTYGGFGTGSGGTNYFEIENDVLIQKKGNVNLEWFIDSNGTTFKYNDEIISEAEYNTIVSDNFNEATLFDLSIINVAN